MKNLTPEVIKQLALAQLLADQSEDQGTEFEDGTYEQGVRDALGWMCGLLDNPPYNPDEWPVTEEELAIMTEGLGLVGIDDGVLNPLWPAVRHPPRLPALGATYRPQRTGDAGRPVTGLAPKQTPAAADPAARGGMEPAPDPRM